MLNPSPWPASEPAIQPPRVGAARKTFLCWIFVRERIPIRREFMRGNGSRVPRLEQIIPVGICFLYERQFPFAPPTLQTCFALYRLGIQRKLLEPHEPGNGVCLYEGGTSSFAMGLDAAMKIGGHSDIERAVAFASQDVDEAAWHCRNLSYRARRSQGGADAPRLDGRVKPGH